MASRRQELPSSQGGLRSYAGEYKSKYQIQPLYILVIACFIAVIVLFMHLL